MSISDEESRKRRGAYYTPDGVARALVSWSVRRDTDRLLDPSCGDGRFLALHRNSVGVERDDGAAGDARARAPHARVHPRDFFEYVASTRDRFECAAGNPPFIRYQRFAGEVRSRALTTCAALGASFSALTSSWAPFLVATASLLKPGGRMSFVVPAEIGHAPYAAPLLSYLAANFADVQIIAIRDKLFPELSEAAWLLHAAGYGDRTDHLRLTLRDRFRPTATPPRDGEHVPITEWQAWRRRLRPFLAPPAVRDLYRRQLCREDVSTLGEHARVGIGYVTGDNAFFHLRPSDAARYAIPARFLAPTVRSGRTLPDRAVTRATVTEWERRDQPFYLLRLRPNDRLPRAIVDRLDSDDAHRARAAYKCRVRDPWWSVPDVRAPDAFLSYMSGTGASLVANRAGVTCTNSVHAVHLKRRGSITAIQRAFDDPLSRLSREIEGHPLGGGMLKLEPREATRIALPLGQPSDPDVAAVAEEGVSALRSWRMGAGTLS